MITAQGQTDVGQHREHNEDTLLIDLERGLFVVADGVGGRARGEVASAEAVEQIQNWIIRHGPLLDEFAARPAEARKSQVRRMVEGGIQAACYMIHGMAEQDPETKGMSTTISMALVLDGLVMVGQVGDSRVYLLRGGRAVQITEDHTLINYQLKMGLITPEEAEDAPGKNVITRAVGHREYVHADVSSVVTRPGDRLLLCSDGLHGYLEHGEIEHYAERPPGETCQSLIDLANDRGGKDNITVLIVDID